MTSKGEITASDEKRQQSGASLFKKKKGFKQIKARGRLRDRSELSDDEEAKIQQDAKVEDSNEETSTMEAILYAKKKRRLLGTKSRSRGLDASKLLQPSSAKLLAAEAETGDVAVEANKDLTERLRGTFAGGTGADAGDGSGNGIIGKKHKDAMEEFIQQKMTSQNNDATAPPSEKGEEKSSTTTSLQPKDMEAQLFAELASTAEELSGTTTKNETGTTVAQTQVQEGDVGAGGAMLGGTGIAEVALPVEERIQVVRATEAAALARQRRREAALPKQLGQEHPVHGVVSSDQMVPMSFSAGLGKRRRKQDDVDDAKKRSVLAPPAGPGGTQNLSGASSDAPTASSAGMDVLNSDVSGLGASYSHNFRMHAHEWVSRKKEEREAELDVERQQLEKEKGPVANQERMGFEAARRAARGEAPLPSTGNATGTTAPLGRDGRAPNERGRDYQQRSSDDRVWKSFMSRQREMRR